MARPKNSDLLKRYRGEIMRSKKWRDEEHFDELWRRMIDLYRGKQAIQANTDEDQIIVNMAFATINVIAPSVAINYPKIAVNARREEFADQATITEAAVNYFWRYGKFQPQFRLAVNDMLMVGHGWCKVGWKRVSAPRPTVCDEEEYDESVPAEDPVEAEEPSVATEMIVSADAPFMERISPFDIYVDPDATHPDMVRWIAQRTRRQLHDVKADTRYKAKARRSTEATTKSNWETEDDRWIHTGSAPGGYVDVFEFYDLMAGTVSTFVERGCEDEFLIPPKSNPFPYGNPYVMLRDYEVPDHFYPMGELEAVEVLQYELNETRSQMMNHRKKYTPKWLYNRARFETDGLEALESDDYNTMVPVDGDGDVESSIAPMPVTTAPAEFYNQSTVIKEDFDMVVGVSDYMRGNMPEIRRTATEAAMLQDAQNARAADKLARIESFLGLAAEKVVQVMQSFTTGDQVFRITGPNGLKVWTHYERDYIQGMFDFEVEGGSTQPNNESFRRQSALQLTDALGPAIEAGVIDVAKLAMYQLQYGFGITNPGDFIAAPPPPMEGEVDEMGNPLDPMGQEPMAPQLDPSMGQAGLGI